MPATRTSSRARGAHHDAPRAAGLRGPSRARPLPALASPATPRFNMQAGTLSAPNVAADDPQHVNELASVFLAPHEHVAEAIPDLP